MVKGCKYLWMEIFTLEIMKTTHHNNMVSIIGQVEPFIEDSFHQECDMERENGKCYMEILIKVSTWMIRKMVKAFTTGRMDQNILVHSKMITGMVMAKCNGMMVDLTKGNGLMESKRTSPFNLIMESIKVLELKVLLIQFQLLKVKKSYRCQKGTTSHLFRRSK